MGDYRYQRMLSPKEQEALDRDLARERQEEEEQYAEARAAVARERAFGFARRQDEK